MLKAVLYLRYSSDRQDSATIETQRNECLAKAKTLDAVVVGEYVDAAQSATTDQRFSYQKLLHDSKAKPRPFDLVIVRKLDRLGRNQIEARLTEEMLEKRGIRILSLYESADTSNPAGWLNHQFMLLINEFYSRNLATETISGMVTNIKRGYRSGGMAPYGYKNVKVADKQTAKERTILEIYEKEAEGVRMMFQLYAEGKGYGQIVKELEARAINPRKAQTWSHSNLCQIMANETYNGVLFWRNGKDPAGWARNPGGAPRIVAEEIWEKVRKRAEGNKKIQDRKAENSAHPLTGMIFCAICGGRFTTGQKNNGKWKVVCSNNRYHKGCENPRVLDELALVTQIKQILMEKIFSRENMILALEQLRDQLVMPTDDTEREIALLRKRIAENTDKQTRVIDEMASGFLPRESCRVALEKMEKEKAILMEKVDVIEKEMAVTQSIKVTEVDIEEFSRIVRDQVEGAEGEQLRKHFKNFGVRVEIGLETGKIEIAPGVFTPSAGSLSAWSGT